MKINLLALSFVFTVFSYALTLKIKTDSMNNLKFSTSNYVSYNPQKPSVMESIITSMPIGVSSRMVILLKKLFTNFFFE